MATEDKEAKLWGLRVKLGDQHYDEWSKRFEVSKLRDYYEGKQFSEVNPLDPNAPYVVNKVLTTVEAQKPSMLSDIPRNRVKPAPGYRDDLSELDPRIALMEATLQTLVSRQDMHYLEHVLQGYHESFFGPGILEVGYSKKFMDNPNAGRPVMVPGEDGRESPKRDPKTNEVVLQDAQTAVEEQLFFRSVPFETFRVPHNSMYILENNEWCGYYENFTVAEVLKAYPEAKSKREHLDTQASDEFKAIDRKPTDQLGTNCKVWKIWDFSTGKKVRFSGGVYLDEEPFTVFPLAIMKYLPWRHHFWPVPPVYNWISPQRAINYSRNLLIRHVRQGIAKYIGRKRAFQPEALEKLLRSEDVEVAWTEEEIESLNEAVLLLPQPTLGLDFHRGLNVMDEDFVESSGTGGEQRGLADSTTATQANILDARAQSREEGARDKVRAALAKLGKAALEIIRENFALPMVVRLNIDPANPNAPAKLQELFQVVSIIDQFPNVDFEVEVDLISKNPASQQMERSAWTQVLQLLSQPGVAIALANSPLLLRKTLDQFDIVSEHEIAEIQKALQAAIQAQQQAEAGPPTPESLVQQAIQSGVPIQ